MPIPRTDTRLLMAPSWQRSVAAGLWACGTISFLSLSASARTMAAAERHAGNPHGLNGVFTIVGLACLPAAVAALAFTVQVWRGRWRRGSLVAASAILLALVVATIVSLLRPAGPPLVALLTVAGTIGLDVVLMRAPLCLVAPKPDPAAAKATATAPTAAKANTTAAEASPTAAARASRAYSRATARPARSR